MVPSSGTDGVVITGSSGGTTAIYGIDLGFTQSDDADATDTNAALNIAVTSSSGDADTLYGINIASITAGAASETAINIGSGWDTAIRLQNGETIDNSTDGTIAFTDGSNTLFSIVDGGTVGNVIVSGDLTISGDDLFLGTNTSGFVLVADGTNFNPVDLSGDIDISSTGATTIAANAVALGADTTGSYLATLADGGSSTITVTGSGSESAAVTLDVVGLSCTDCLGATQIADLYLLNTGDTATGVFDFTGAEIAGAIPFIFEGTTTNDFETRFAITNPTADRTITFKDASGTVAFTSDILVLWETGTNGTFEDDAAVIVGPDVPETLSNSGFSLSGNNDLFVGHLLGVEGNIYTDGSFIAGASLTLADGSITQSTGGALTINLGGAAGDDFIVDTSTLVVESDNNRVGIGTTAPAEILHVVASGVATIRVDGSGAGGARLELHNTFASSEDWRIQAGIGGVSDNYLSFRTMSDSTDRLVITNTGNVGIGTTTPDAKLDVLDISTSTTAATTKGLEFTITDTGVVTTGTDTLTGQQLNVTRTGATGGTINTIGLDINVTGSTGGTSTLTGLDVNVSGADTNYAAIFLGGNVGIGTATPSEDLHVFGSGVQRIIVESSDDQAGIEFISDSADNFVIFSPDASADLAIFDGTSIVVTFQDGGNVGIGTTGPEARLQVTGGGLCVGTDANCNTDNDAEGVIYSGSTAMTVYDVAEMYPTADASIVPAEIVALDPDNGVFVKRAEAGDKRLLGVISTDPAVLLGGFAGTQFADEHQVAVSLSGRVPVKVTTESGAIAIGDLLTVSSQPGVARKAAPGEQTIGYALESYAGDGVGSIQLFVNLQQGTAQPTDTSEPGSELGGDSVGLAKILPGDTEVFVAFGQEYPDQPVVTVTPMDFFTGQYKISDVGVGGFTIVLSEAQQADTSFSWRASGAAETVLQLSNGVAVDFEG